MRQWTVLAAMGTVMIGAWAASGQNAATRPATTQTAGTQTAPTTVAGMKVDEKGRIAFKDLMGFPEKGQQKLDGGLIVQDLVEGTGASAGPTSTVVCHYTGWLIDGSKFDSSRDRGEMLTIPLDHVIKGWQLGMQGMKVGGRRKLIIPGSLGYGPGGSGEMIPPNATLVFDVELIEVK